MLFISLIVIACFCAPNTNSQYFDYITIKIYRNDKPVTLLQADTVNNEEEVTDVSIEFENLPILKTGTFQNLSYLRNVHINSNNLEILEPHSFRNVSNLRLINLNFNRIKIVPENVFANLTVFKISLRGNSITTLHPNAFYNLSDLEVLDLNSNKIKELPQDLFYLTNNIRQFDLGYNQFENYFDDYKYFDEALSNIQRYQDSLLDLSFNNFTEINNNFLRGVQFVKELLLNNNNIRRIGEMALDDLRWAETVDLEGNDLEELNDKVLSALQVVQNINLQNNPWSNSFVCKYERWCEKQEIVNTMDMACNTSEYTY